MYHARTVPSTLRAPHLALIVALALSSNACAGVRQTLATPPEVLLIPGGIANAAELTPGLPPAAHVPAAAAMTATLLLRVDVAGGDRSIAERVRARPFAADAGRAAVVIFGGAGRDAADVLRVLASDSSSRVHATVEVARAVAADSVRLTIIAAHDVTSRDVVPVLEGMAAFAAAVRAAGVPLVAAVVPAGDTTAYPTRELAGIVDLLLLLPASPRALAKPAAPLIAGSLRRAIGRRAAAVGTARLIVFLPLHGYAWPTDSLARAISYSEAVDLAARWHASFTRDPDSRMLRARAVESGEIWVPDAETIAYLMREIRLMGVRRFALPAGAGEDPRIWTYVVNEAQTTSNSR